jgi:hypothetical protein
MFQLGRHNVITYGEVRRIRRSLKLRTANVEERL